MELILWGKQLKNMINHTKKKENVFIVFLLVLLCVVSIPGLEDRTNMPNMPTTRFQKAVLAEEQGKYLRMTPFGAILKVAPVADALTLQGHPLFSRTLTNFVFLPFYSAQVTEVTSPFGWRIHPILGTRKFHSGVDLGYDYNQPILAAFSGVVIYAANYSRAGNTVIIRHDEGTYTLYGHYSKLLVTMGEPVRAGQLIALAGSTGYSTGPHLHFEIWQNGVFIDPMNYIQK